MLYNPPMPRYDSFSVGEYGERVCIFRWEEGGPFYAEIQGKRRVIKLPQGRRIRNAKDGRQWALEKHRELKRGAPEYSLGTLFAQYLEHRTPLKATAQGRKADARLIAMWTRVLGPTADPLSTSRGDIDHFIQRRGLGMIDAWGVARSPANKPARGISRRAKPGFVDVGSSGTGGDPNSAISATAGSQLATSGVRPRTVHADLQWLRGVLRFGLRDRCPIAAQDIAMRKIARELKQTAEPRRPVATQERYAAIMKHLDSEGADAKAGRGRRGAVRRCGSPLLTPAEGSAGIDPDQRPPSNSPRTEKENEPFRFGYLSQVLVLVAGTGHRLSEILHLRYADLDLKAEPFGAIRWRAENTGNKARLDRTIPITLVVRESLSAYMAEHPGIGEAWLFPAPRKPHQPVHRSVADKWLRLAERQAGIQPQPGSLWHAYRRKWATEKKHLPATDVAFAGGWKNTRTLQAVYQQADPQGVLRVVLDTAELREEKG